MDEGKQETPAMQPPTISTAGAADEGNRARPTARAAADGAGSAADAEDRPQPKAPPASTAKRADPRIPRPTGPAPGVDRATYEASLPYAPDPIETPNLAGPDALKLDLDQLRLENPDLQKSRFGKLSHKAKIAIYIASAIVVIAIVAIAVVVSMPQSFPL